MARDLLAEPLWKAEHLGRPIPDSPHAVSVTMPTWASVIGYEEEDPSITGALSCGYPRFFCHPSVSRLFEETRKRQGRPGEKALVLFSRGACERCKSFLSTRIPDLSASDLRIEPIPGTEAQAIFFPERAWKEALLYWRFTGEIVSSRQAEALLSRQFAAETHPGDEVCDKLRKRLARWSGEDADHIHLFPSGMAAFFAAFRAANHFHPGRKTAQLGFPYVDALCVQKELGAGVCYLQGTDLVAQLEATLGKEPLSAVFCEVPSNPLLHTIDLLAVSRWCREHELPFVIDDTIATVHNVDLSQVADAVVTSLTKNISGVGDVMAGSLTVCRKSPFAARLQAFLKSEADGGLWWEDAVVLEANSRDFPERMDLINMNAEALSDYFGAHPVVDKVFFPKNQGDSHYADVQRPGRGFGGLISVVLRDAERTSPLFYDRLELTKGPSLGTNFTLVCPYTLLAHYRELDWVASCGVSSHLIRIAVGMEPTDELIERFERAFSRLDFI